MTFPCPTKKTLDKYGLTEAEWMVLYNKYDGACHICRKVPNGHLNVDHEHCKNWKKLPDEKRKATIRGLLCFSCNNRLMTKGITIQKLENAIIYMKEHEKSKVSS